MSKISCVLLDLDGTLLNFYGDISPSANTALRRLAKRGIKLGIASGRPFESIIPILDKNNLTRLFSFIIASGGCDYVNMETGTHTTKGFMTLKDVRTLAKKVEPLGLNPGIFHQGRYVFSRTTPRAMLFSILQRRKSHYDFGSIPGDLPVSKIYLSGSPKALAAFGEGPDKKHFKIFPAQRSLSELYRSGIDKVCALPLVLEDFDLVPEEIVTFGNDESDENLLKATNGYVMLNGPDALKDKIGQVTKYSNTQDGVAYQINKFIVEKKHVLGNPDFESQE